MNRGFRISVDYGADQATIYPGESQVGNQHSPLVVPPDKSITHRAYLLAAVATGRSQILNPLRSADCQATKAAIEAFGCNVV